MSIIYQPPSTPFKVVKSFMGSPFLNVLIIDIFWGAELKKNIEKTFFSFIDFDGFSDMNTQNDVKLLEA